MSQQQTRTSTCDVTCDRVTWNENAVVACDPYHAHESGHGHGAYEVVGWLLHQLCMQIHPQENNSCYCSTVTAIYLSPRSRSSRYPWYGCAPAVEHQCTTCNCLLLHTHKQAYLFIHPIAIVPHCCVLLMCNALECTMAAGYCVQRSGGNAVVVVWSS